MSGSLKLMNGSESDCVFQHQQTTAQSSECPSWPSQVCRKTPSRCPLHLRSSRSSSKWWKYGEISQRGNSFSSQTAYASSRTCFPPSFQDGNGGLFLLFVWLWAPSILAYFLWFYPVVILDTGLLCGRLLHCVPAFASPLSDLPQTSSNQKDRRCGRIVFTGSCLHCVFSVVITTWGMRGSLRAAGIRNNTMRREKNPKNIGSYHFISNCFQLWTLLNHQMLDVLLQGNSIYCPTVLQDLNVGQ